MKYPHNPPPGYEYWSESYSKTIDRIWIRNLGEFTYTEDKPSTVWGFYNKRTGEYIAPINWKKPGKVVKVEDTSPYSAMVLQLNPLEAVMWGA